MRDLDARLHGGSGKHVVVTGAGSYIGRVVAERLVHDGACVSVTCRGTEPTGIANVELIPLDICDAAHFERLPSRIDSVVHIAAATPRHSLDEIVRASAVGTLNVQDYAIKAGARTIVFASSLSVHGRIEQSVVDERTPIIEPDVYGAAKLLAERILATRANEVPAVAIRLPSVLGDPGGRPWLPSVVRQLRAHEAVEVFNPEAAFNNVVEVSSLAEFISSLVLKQQPEGFHAFPLAASEEMSIGSVVNELKRMIGSRSAIRVSHADRPSFTISSAYAIRSFHYSPLTTAATLRRFAESLA